MRLLATCLILSAAAVPAFAQPFANAKTSLANYTVADSTPQKSCESLAAFKSDGIVSIKARVVPAAADTPQHCRVTGIITPEVAFEVNLPDRWNRRFYMTGNGGLAGDALDGPTSPDRTAGLSNGFVHARTNTGHDARQEPSGSFILSNPQKAIDYAYRAVHVTAETAKKIAADYYAQPIQFSYLELLLERRPSGAARGTALSRRLRRHRRKCAMGRSDRLHCRGDVESESGDRGTPLACEDAPGRAESHGQMRRRRRSQGRTD